MTENVELLHQQLASRIKITALLATIAYLLFTFVDPFLYPGHTVEFLIYRLIAIFYVSLLLLLRKRIAEQHIMPIVYFSALIIPLPTTLETFHTEGFASPYYVGLILIDIGGRLVYPLQAKNGLKVSAIIFTPYLILSFLQKNYGSGQAIQSIFHIAVSMLISAIGGELLFRLYMNKMRTERELKRLNERLADQSLRDPLTNAFNRRYLQQILEHQIALYHRHETPFSLIISDLDNFKEINDRSGHQIGDRILSEVCTTIHKRIRKEDILFRFGGDEFALILPNTTREFAANLGERIRMGIRELKTDRGGESNRLTISLGVAQIKQKDTDQSIIRRADQALYRAKQAGRDRVEVAWEAK